MFDEIYDFAERNFGGSRGLIIAGVVIAAYVGISASRSIRKRRNEEKMPSIDTADLVELKKLVQEKNQEIASLKRTIQSAPRHVMNLEILFDLGDLKICKRHNSPGRELMDF